MSSVDVANVWLLLTASTHTLTRYMHLHSMNTSMTFTSIHITHTHINTILAYETERAREGVKKNSDISARNSPVNANKIATQSNTAWIHFRLKINIDNIPNFYFSVDTCKHHQRRRQRRQRQWRRFSGEKTTEKKTRESVERENV